MATAVLLPKQGNSVESCIINAWMKKEGDAIKTGDVLCEVQTDKAAVEVEAGADGVLLKIFRAVGDDVPVQTVIAAIGAPGEDVSALAPAGAAPAAAPAAAAVAAPAAAAPAPVAAPAPAAASDAGSSPRARALAEQKGIDVAAVAGTGPNGLVIERDVRAAQLGGTGLGGRITAADKAAPAAAPVAAAPAPKAAPGAETVIPVKGIRKIIADRMRQSLSGSAQLTLHATAKAATLQAWRAKAKDKAEALGLPAVTVNDLVLFAVARTLPRFPGLNAHWKGDSIVQHSSVHLGMAVDTEKGLLVPVLKDAHAKTLAQISTDAKALAKAAQAGKASPDQLSGSTFSVTNVGALGIEYFTPVLNVPEVAILGVGAITLRPYQGAAGVEFVPSMHLSRTIDHQALDGAPAARFLQALVAAIENIDVLLAA